MNAIISKATPLTLAMIVADTGDWEALQALECCIGTAEAAALVAFVQSKASAHLFRQFFELGGASLKKDLTAKGF